MIYKVRNIVKEKWKIIIPVIVILIILILALTRQENSKSFTNELLKLGFKDSPEQFICEDIKKESNLMMSTRKYSFIAIDGEVYNISFSKKFSNEQNCEKRNFETKVTSHIDNIVVGEDKKYYSVYEDLIPKEDLEFQYNIEDIVEKGYQFVLKKDGNIYYQENKEDTDFTLKYKKEDVEGNIQRFGIINSDYTENEERKIVVMTDKAIYYTKANNKEKCKKFADVKCDYELIKDKILSKYRKYILYVDDTILITTEGKVMYTNSYFDNK